VIRTLRILLLSVPSILSIGEVKRMKKVFLSMMLTAALLMVGNTAMAYPLLQLDIVGGEYDWGSESVVTGDSNFELVALLNPESGKYRELADPLSTQQFVLVASSFSAFEAPTVTPIDKDGKFGVPIDEDESLPDNPQMNHGELGTFGYEFTFTFDSYFKTSAYNTQDDPGEFAGYDSSGSFYYQTFDVTLTDFPVHFDLYAYTDKDKPGRGGNKVFAPFSHDATAVPEPATMLLLGTGLIVSAGLGRKMFRRKG